MAGHGLELNRLNSSGSVPKQAQTANGNLTTYPENVQTFSPFTFQSFPLEPNPPFHVIRMAEADFGRLPGDLRAQDKVLHVFGRAALLRRPRIQGRAAALPYLEGEETLRPRPAGRSFSG